MKLPEFAELLGIQVSPHVKITLDALMANPSPSINLPPLRSRAEKLTGRQQPLTIVCDEAQEVTDEMLLAIDQILLGFKCYEVVKAEGQPDNKRRIEPSRLRWDRETRTYRIDEAKARGETNAECDQANLRYHRKQVAAMLGPMLKEWSERSWTG